MFPPKKGRKWSLVRQQSADQEGNLIECKKSSNFGRKRVEKKGQGDKEL